MSKLFLAENIVYDTDGEKIEGLPESIMTEAESEDEVADLISDEAGFCVLSFDLKVLREL